MEPGRCLTTGATDQNECLKKNFNNCQNKEISKEYYLMKPK